MVHCVSIRPSLLSTRFHLIVSLTAIEKILSRSESPALNVATRVASAGHAPDPSD